MKRFMLLIILCTLGACGINVAAHATTDQEVIRNFKLFLYGYRFDNIENEGLSNEQSYIQSLKRKYYSGDHQTTDLGTAKKARAFLYKNSPLIINDENQKKFSDILDALSIDLIISLGRVSLHKDGSEVNLKKWIQYVRKNIKLLNVLTRDRLYSQKLITKMNSAFRRFLARDIQLLQDDNPNEEDLKKVLSLYRQSPAIYDLLARHGNKAAKTFIELCKQHSHKHPTHDDDDELNDDSSE